MRALTPLAAIAVLLLAGCSAQPPRDDVVERFAIELEAASDGLLEQDDEIVLELAEGLADDAYDGRCSEPAYWSGLGEQPSLLYAWATTCEMYFADEMPDTLRDWARELLLEQVAGDLAD